ncbi:MAG: serine/threonine protein kinase [Burkholderiales bacterium]|nr:serine/threonine protein kinase [Burkholderiales bacterium]
MAAQSNSALPENTILENYRIARPIASGGFSIVYLAYDEYGSPVAIKEYLPAGLSLRGQGQILPTITPEHVNLFRYGMKCFFEEGRALAKISHPNVVRVINFFRANETVYMVMQYERGRTLQEHIVQRKGEIKENFIRHVFVQLMNGLREVHTNKLLHLDLKPANIYIRNDGIPVLLDFGAARQTLIGDAPKLNPMYTPGFAAPEQYRNREALGPWTDIYSIGASMFACLSGMAPQAADQRLEKDRMQPVARTFKGKYSKELLEIIDWCLDMDHLKRPQSVFSLQKAIVDNRIPDAQRPGALAGFKRMLDDLSRPGDRDAEKTDTAR